MIKKVNKIIKKDMPNDGAPIIVELVNQSDGFVTTKSLAKINEVLTYLKLKENVKRNL
jgi:hypothetical protein